MNGTSIGTAMLTRPCSLCGAISSVAGNGHSGLVSFGTMRVSASTPTTSVTASASTRGCAAIARVGRNSSQRFGSPAPVALIASERQSFAHSRRATRSRNGSLRSRSCSRATCSLTCRSSSGRTSLDTFSRTPTMVMLASAIEKCVVRFGSSRQAGVSCGCETTATLPRISVRWSRVRPASFSTLRPTSLPRIPPSAPPRPPAAVEAICPVARSVPVSTVETPITSGLPNTPSGPRFTVQPISALERSFDAMLSRLPVRSRGACASSISRRAPSVITVGATMVEVRLTGGSGGTSASAGRRLLSAPGHSSCMSSVAPTNAIARMATPINIVRRRMQSQPRCKHSPWPNECSR